MRLLCAAAVLCGATSVAHSATLHVDDDHAGTPDGSAARPYRTLQAAIDAAQNGDEVRVATGSYGPTRLEDKTLLLRGGYVGGSAAGYTAGTPGDFAASSPGTQLTTLTGNASTAALFLYNCGLSSVEGFVITGGQRGIQIGSDDFADAMPDRCAPLIRGNLIEGNGDPALNGGGIDADDCRAQIVGNVIRGNLASRGAGISSDCKGLRIENNRIENNVGHGDHGGGLNLSNANIVVRGNHFEGNRIGEIAGYGWGGGGLIYGGGTTATLENNVWTGNHGQSVGSGLFIDDGASVNIVHDLFYANECADQGGHGLYVDGTGTGVASSATLINVTIAGHPCTGGLPGGGIFVERDSTVTIRSSILWQNGGDDFAADGTSTIVASYTLSQEAISGTGNLSVDPLFAGMAAGDFHVKSTKGRFDPGSQSFVLDAVDSPTIDTGDPAGDFSAEPGPNGLRINMGHTGGTGEASMGAPGGTPPADAGPPPDANPFGDAGPLVDAGGGPGDPDGGTITPGKGGGCGCRTTGASTTPSLAFLLLGAIAWRRRRRPR